MTQEKLAEAIGVSYPYLLSIETGQREMSVRVAEAIFVVTMVHPKWLLGEIGESEMPIDIGQLPYTEETYLSARHPLTLVGPLHPHLLDGSSFYMRAVHVLLRAATRKGKYRMAEYYLNNCIKDAQEALELTSMMESEGEEVGPPDLPPAANPETAAVGNRAFRQTLSWRAVADWRAACAGTPEDRENFRRALDEARAVVEMSFDYADGKLRKGVPVTFVSPETGTPKSDTLCTAEIIDTSAAEDQKGPSSDFSVLVTEDPASDRYSQRAPSIVPEQKSEVRPTVKFREGASIEQIMSEQFAEEMPKLIKEIKELLNPPPKITFPWEEPNDTVNPAKPPSERSSPPEPPPTGSPKTTTPPPSEILSGYSMNDLIVRDVGEKFEELCREAKRSSVKPLEIAEPSQPCTRKKTVMPPVLGQSSLPTDSSAESPKTSTPPPASPARGSGEKASSGQSARAARKSPRRS